MSVRAAIVLSVAGMATSAYAADWSAAVSGIWEDPINWAPANVPDMSGETATLGLSGAYTVSLSSSPTIDALTVSNPDVVLNLVAGADLMIDAANGISNNGEIVVNSTFSSVDAAILYNVSGPLKGSGVMRMTRAADSRLETAIGAVISQEAGHTIIGTGLIRGALANDGSVSAQSGRLELLTEGKSNTGTIEALMGGDLTIRAIAVDQTGGGEIVARDGGIVTILGDSTILGGLLRADVGGVVAPTSATTTIEDCEIQGLFEIRAGATVAITGAGVLNNGSVVVNPAGSAVDSALRFDANGTLSGTGEVVMIRTADSRLEASPGVSVVNGPAHTIRGVGLLRAPMHNEGLISADRTGTLSLIEEPKSNEGLMEALSGSELSISGIEVSQSVSGMIAADGGLVTIGLDAIIDGGMLTSANGGLIQRSAIGTALLDGVTTDAAIDVIGGGSFDVMNGLVNDGVITVDSNFSSADSALTFLDSSALSGAGEVILTRAADSRIETAMGETMTHEAGHTIRGGGLINASINNHGLILADAGIILSLQVEDKFNDGVIRAINNSIIDINDVEITQSGGARGIDGLIESDAATIRFNNGASVVGGDLVTIDVGTFVVNPGTASWRDVTLAGSVNMVGGSTLDVSGDFKNDGVINIDANFSSADSLLVFQESLVINGVGAIRLRRTTDAQIQTAPGVTVTNSSTHLIEGVGVIGGALVNDGLVQANEVGTLLLNNEPKINNSVIQAINSSRLQIDSCEVTQDPASELHADNAEMLHSGVSSLTGGLLTSANDGYHLLTGALTADDVTNLGDVRLRAPATLAIGPAGFTNDGAVIVNENFSSADTHVRSSGGSTVIRGSGTMTLTRSVDALVVGDMGRIRQAASHTINGAGIVGRDFINNGTIIADATSAMNIDGDGGFVNNGLIKAVGAGGVNIVNGAGFENAGTIDIQSSFNAGSAFTHNGGETILDGAMTGGSQVVYAGGVLRGTGGFNGAFASELVIDGAMIRPGDGGPGVLAVAPQLTMTAAAEYEVDWHGAAAGEFDSLDCQNAHVGGAIVVDYGTMSFPQVGDEIVIVSSVGAVTGEFDTLSYLDIGPPAIYVVQEGTTVKLVATCVGDINGSGAVDFDDLNILLEEWGSTGTRGDVDNSGGVDFNDLNALLEQWGASCL